MITTDCLQVICPHLDLNTILALLWSCTAIRSQIREIQPRINDIVSFIWRRSSPKSLWKHIKLQHRTIQFPDCVSFVTSWSPSAAQLALAIHRIIYIWNDEKKQSPGTLSGHITSIRSLTYNSDGSLLASGSDDNTICIWSKSVLLSRLYGHTNTVWSLDWSPDSTRLVSCADDGKLCLWDWRKQTILQHLKPRDMCSFLLVFSPDGVTVAFTASRTCYLWNTSTLELREIPRLPDMCHHLAFSPDNTRLALAHYDGLIQIHDTQTLETVSSLRTNMFQRRFGSCLVAFSPDGSQLVSYYLNLIIWDVKTGTQIRCISQFRTERAYGIHWSQQHGINLVTCVEARTAKKEYSRKRHIRIVSTQ